MSIAIILNTKPSECEKIMNGNKTMVVARVPYPIVSIPFRCYIYCSDPLRKVIGEFVCDQVYELAPLNHAPDDVEQQACMTREEIVKAIECDGFAWHISNLNIYKTPKELSYYTSLIKTHPYNWRYLAVHE